jgi:hypothetical protein
MLKAAYERRPVWGLKNKKIQVDGFKVSVAELPNLLIAPRRVEEGGNLNGKRRNYHLKIL